MTANGDRARTPEGVFGRELKYYRDRAGLSQVDLAALVNCSNSVICKIETGDRAPAEDFPERLDTVAELDTRGSLARLWGWLRESARHATPGWFEPWKHVEAEATILRSYEPLIVPGLLQTEEYARAILAAEPGSKPDDRDDQVTERMQRQSILARPDAPQLWSVLDEGVLHRRVGSAKIMQDQLEHLADLAEQPETAIQVIPESAGAHAGLLGGFVIADLDGSPGMVYLETSAEGQIADSPVIVAQVRFRFDSLRGEALPRGASRELIMKVMSEKWT